MDELSLEDYSWLKIITKFDCQFFLNSKVGIVVYANNPRTHKAETGELLWVLRLPWIKPKVKKRRQKERKSRRMGKNAIKCCLLSMTHGPLYSGTHSSYTRFTTQDPYKITPVNIPALVGLGFPRVSTPGWVWQFKASGWVRPFCFMNVAAGRLSVILVDSLKIYQN